MKTTSKQGQEMIKRFEGFSAKAYRDGNGYSIGYGHNGAAANQTINQAEAEELLQQDLRRFETSVNAVSSNLTQGQFDAAVSLAYNIGAAAFSRSTLAALLAADPTPRPELEHHWKEWRIASGKVNPTLEKRRAEEYEYYKKHSTNTKVVLMTVAALAAAVTLTAITLS